MTRDGRLLLGLRTGAHGAATWAPPGGKPDAGEPPEAAAARELEEETGLVATRVRPVAWTSDVFVAEGLHYVTLHHEVEVQPGETRSGVIREDDFAEAELDLDAIGRWMASAAAVLINASEVNAVWGTSYTAADIGDALAAGLPP